MSHLASRSPAFTREKIDHLALDIPPVDRDFANISHQIWHRIIVKSHRSPEV